MSDTPRTVFCSVLKKESAGLDAPPWPGELGGRIYDSVSREGWKDWLQRLVMIINENQINTADPAGVQLIEMHMRGFLFGEGDLGQLPDGFMPMKKG